MQIVYAKEPFPNKVNKTLFLAGPTPRDNFIESWRMSALQSLKDLGYDGHVFVPEPKNKSWQSGQDAYLDQIEWEEEALNRADCILFWIPRNLKLLPGLTTNDEFGTWKNSGKVILGTPAEAEKVRYQQSYAKKLGIPQADSLQEALKLALNFLGSGSSRKEAECCVPLLLWNNVAFQTWHQAQKNAGNLLAKAKVLWSFRPNNKTIFAWILQASVWIADEQRMKSNEFIFGRSHIVTGLLIHQQPNILDSEVILVREFRTPATTEDGFIRELPGGSSKNSNEDVLNVIQHEVKEETGLEIRSERYKFVTTKQLVGTLSVHQGSLFVAKISDQELETLLADEGRFHGVSVDTERTYVEIFTVRDLLDKNLTDWSTLGMIFQGVFGNNKE